MGPARQGLINDISLGLWALPAPPFPVLYYMLAPLIAITWTDTIAIPQEVQSLATCTVVDRALINDSIFSYYISVRPHASLCLVI